MEDFREQRVEDSVELAKERNGRLYGIIDGWSGQREQRRSRAIIFRVPQFFARL